MSNAPWLDIPPKSRVKEVLLGKEHGVSSGTKYANLVRAVETYHAVRKDEHQQFGFRATQLNFVVDAAKKAATEARSARHREYLKLLAERAAAKAMYLQDIAQYLQRNTDQINDLRGFLKIMESKRAPTVTLPPPAVQNGWQHGKVGGGTFGMAGGVAFEQMDPLHREFEITVGKGGDPWGPSAHGGGIGRYLVEWANLVIQQGYNKPFLAYLETSEVCHYATDPNLYLSVKYATDGELLAGTSVVTLGQGARLHETKASGQVEMFDTADATGPKAGRYHAKAYVWTTTGELVVGIHESGKLHHSSLIGGGIVKCAGMIGATAGRVHYVDGNSGHYRPPPANVHAFITYLNQNDLFTADAKTTVQGNETAITDYLFSPARSFFGPSTRIGGHRK
jgi:hypothetical protein